VQKVRSLDLGPMAHVPLKAPGLETEVLM